MSNLSNQESRRLDDLFSDAQIISSSLTSGGYPDDWEISNVIRVGFTNDNNKINNSKFREFAKLNYNKSRKLLGTTYDYFAFFFLNESGDVQNIEGYCGIGYPDINLTYNMRSAYYYKNSDGETHLKSFMEGEFYADLYCDGGPSCPEPLTRIDLNNNIDNYGFVVIESPEWSTSQFVDFEDKADDWVENGGLLMMGGRLPAATGADGFGVEFRKESGDAEKNRIANVTNEDEFISFDIEDNILFVQNYYVEDVSIGPDFKEIALFNLTGNIALARWPLVNGNIFFFSDFDATYFSGDFLQEVKAATRKWIGANCLPVNISGIERERLVRVNRLLIYNSDIVNMVLYVWD